MSSKGLHWYTNDIEEACLKECPVGWHKGRLKVSEETRQKMRDSNWISKCSKEELGARNKKIALTIQSRTIEEKEEYSKKISKARTGKGTGNTPWNKGLKGAQVAWNKGLAMPEDIKQKLRDAYANTPEEEKNRRKQFISNIHKNKTPWNKGLTYTLDKDTIRQMKIKENITKKKNGTYIKSIIEDKCYFVLESIFGSGNIIRQYTDDRYPYNCDFYIPSLDLFIEINGTWTHQNHPFSSSAEDLSILENWSNRSDSDYYKNAIYTWTELDVNKEIAAKSNKLNYIRIYPENTLDFNEELNKEYTDLAALLYYTCTE